MSSLDNRSSSPRNIIFLFSALSVGGSEKKVSKVANYLEQIGWRIDIAYLNPPDDLSYAFSRAIAQTCFHRQLKLDLKTVLRLRSFVLERRPEIIVAVNLFPLLYLYLSGCLAHSKSFRIIALINQTTYRRGLVGRLREAFNRKILKKLDHLVFGAEFQRKLWEDSYGLGVVDSTVIYNGVDTEFFSPKAVSQSRSTIRAAIGIDNSDFVLVSIAGLRPVKNLSLLLDALHALRVEHPRIKAVLVGDGPDRARLEAQTEKLGLHDIVRFMGKIEDVRPVLSAADVFVLTSDSETFSNAALEAMSMAKAVILPDIDGCPEMVDERVNGWLFSAGCAASLSDRILKASNDLARCQIMGEAARQYVLERFPNDEMLRNYETLVDEVAQSH